MASGRLGVVVEQGQDLLHPTVRLVFDTARMIALQPRDLHLSEFTEQIVDYEEPQEWGLDSMAYL